MGRADNGNAHTSIDIAADFGARCLSLHGEPILMASSIANRLIEIQNSNLRRSFALITLNVIEEGACADSFSFDYG
jgi:hypothetical protein